MAETPWKGTKLVVVDMLECVALMREWGDFESETDRFYGSEQNSTLE